MSDEGRADHRKRDASSRLAASWQIPVLLLAVGGWVVFLLVSGGGEPRASRMEIERKASASEGSEKAAGEETGEKTALETGRALRVKGDTAGAEAALEQGLKEAKVGEAKGLRLELGKVLMDEHKYGEAKRMLAAAGATRPADEVLDREAEFLAAECSLGLGRTDEAEKAFVEIARKRGTTEEGIAARMRLARIYLEGARRDEARSELSRVLGSLGKTSRLENRYAEDRELRTMWGEVVRHLVEGSEFDAARGVIAEGGRRGLRDVLLYSEALTTQREAESLSAKAKGLEEKGLLHDASMEREEAKRLRLRAAGLYLEIVNSSEMARSKLFGDALWQGANCLYEGGDYARAAVYYGLFHRSALNDEQRGRARLQHGRAMAALGSHKEAIENFESVAAEFPGTLIACEGTYAAGLSRTALGEYAEARKLFEEIVGNEELLST